MTDRRLDKKEFTSSQNALRNWSSFQNSLKVALNIVIITIAKFLPLTVKNKFLRLTGMKVGKGASIALGSMFDVIVPEKIEIGERTTIGYGTTVLAHEATQDEFKTGKVEIGDNVLIGANSTVLAGVKIGDNATISAHSLVNRDVEKGEFVGGVPIETIEKEDETNTKKS